MLSPETERKLDYWLSRDTWPTMHPSDMISWYDFVDEYQKGHGYELDGVALREHIERKIGGEVTEYLRDNIIRYISIADHILRFLKQTGR